MENKFDNLAHEWDANPVRIKLTQKAVAAIRRHVPLTPAMRLLDYGTGTGLVMLGLQPYVGHITGMDNSEGMIDVLKTKTQAAEIQDVALQLHNIDTQPLPRNRFELITINMALHHIADTARFVAEAYAALTAGGRLCITDLVAEDGSFHGTADASVKHLGFEQDTLNQLLTNAGFEIQTNEVFHVVEREAERGGGKYPLFIAVAEK